MGNNSAVRGRFKHVSSLNQYRRFATVAAFVSATLLTPSIRIHAIGHRYFGRRGANTQRIVAIPRQGRKAIVLSLQCSLSWTNSQGSSSGFLKYQWGVLDDGGRFLPTASETPDRVQLAPTDGGFAELTVDRSILFAVKPNTASSEDVLIAIRIDECAIAVPIPARRPDACFPNRQSSTSPMTLRRWIDVLALTQIGRRHWSDLSAQMLSAILPRSRSPITARNNKVSPKGNISQVRRSARSAALSAFSDWTIHPGLAGRKTHESTSQLEGDDT